MGGACTGTRDQGSITGMDTARGGKGDDEIFADSTNCGAYTDQGVFDATLTDNCEIQNAQ